MLACIALGWNLGGHRFLDPDEGRNAEVAREMSAGGDYLLPHLDNLPYLDKPVFYFAAAALSMDVLGPSETAARLPAYLATLGTIAIVVWFARRRWGAAAGWIAGLALATMPLTLAYARTTIFDSTLSFFTTAAIVAFISERPVLAWAAMGAGGLTKGPVALLIPLAAIVPYVWLVGGRVRSIFPWRGLVAFAVVALPWFIAVSRRLPEFPHYVFVRETLERVTTRDFHRTAPWWYYLPIIPVAAFPWIVPALSRLRHWKWAWLARRVNVAARDALLLACWVLGPLVFFTVNQSKLPQYVLPLMPAFALAAARILTTDGAGVASRVYLAVAGVLGVALVTIGGWLPAGVPLTSQEVAALPPSGRAIGVVLLVSAALVFVAARRRNLSLAAAGYAIGVIAFPFVTGSLMHAVGDDRSAYALAEAVRGRGAIVAIRAYPTSLPFYLQQQLPIYTPTGRELTSNYIADYVDKYRQAPGSPLLVADAWRDRLAACTEHTVFIARPVDRDVIAALAALPKLYDNGRYAAYGPC